MENSSRRTSLLWVRRLSVIVFLFGYLGAGAYFFYGHLLGDSGRFAVGYFWTWDMFPNYPSFSARRLALGQTKAGRFVKVFPTSNVRYRRGGNRDLTRFDLPRNDSALRNAVAATLEKHASKKPADPVTYVFLIEEFWPVRFNLPDDRYRRAYGEENPERRAWRILDEGTVSEDGEIRWTSAQ